MDKLQEIAKEIKELKKIAQEAEAKKKKAVSKANMDAPQVTHDDFNFLLNEMDHMIMRVHERISILEENFFNYIHEHLSGHIPPVKSTEQMQRVLDTLGLNEEYEVRKPVISVANNRRKVVYEIDAGSKNKS